MDCSFARRSLGAEEYWVDDVNEKCPDCSGDYRCPGEDGVVLGRRRKWQGGNGKGRSRKSSNAHRLPALAKGCRCYIMLRWSQMRSNNDAFPRVG